MPPVPSKKMWRPTVKSSKRQEKLTKAIQRPNQSDTKTQSKPYTLSTKSQFLDPKPYREKAPYKTIKKEPTTTSSGPS